MPKLLSFRKGLLSVLFWSIISAAFIGPGTVTTASKAGASFGISLLWALLFSTIATIVLQEAAARITIASGKNLGEIIALRYRRNGTSVKWFVFLAIAVGCAAYQAGNMLGAISGLALLTAVPTPLLTIIIALLTAALLWWGNFKTIANVLGMVVALMGIVFIYAAFQTDFTIGELLQKSLVPSIPEGSLLLVIGLVGTTIVPYNLFLASGISKGQSMREMRIGIAIAVLIGGFISMAILVAGAQLDGAFSFQAIADNLSQKLGVWGGALFGVGLFAAGLTSSITSPLAAAVTAKSIFETDTHNWDTKSRNFRSVWMIVLGIGCLFGVLQIKPIPIIILAQVANGMLLPIVVIFLTFAVNDLSLLGTEYVNNLAQNILALLIVFVTSFLGLNNILNVLNNGFLMSIHQYIIAFLVALLIVIVLISKFLASKRLKSM